MAASGGTLMVLSANDVVMGPMSHLTPIDTQVPYNGQLVSSYSMNRALSRLTDFFETKTADEAPYPWRAMTDKLDPILMEDWTSYLREMQNYARELMKMSNYGTNEINKIINNLVFPAEPHTFVIDKDRAETIGIRISKSADDMINIKAMKAWLTGYMLKQSQKHIIRFLLPQIEEKDHEETKEDKDNQ